MKPILKWAGGKSSLIQDIKMFLPKDIEKRKYHEPFFGGGALFFDLEPKKGTINDVNEKLINFYKIVKEQPESLILEASAYQKYATDVEKYYELREEFNDSNLSDLKSAALFLYFNKTAYNGLYRVNSQNKFNVPIGKYKKPNIVNKKRIREASKILKNIEILCEDFIYIEKKSSEGDFCYFDYLVCAAVNENNLETPMFYVFSKSELDSVSSDIENKSKRFWHAPYRILIPVKPDPKHKGVLYKDFDLELAKDRKKYKNRWDKIKIK